MLGLAWGGVNFTVTVEAMCLLYCLDEVLGHRRGSSPRGAGGRCNDEKGWSFQTRSDMMFVAYRQGWTGVVAEWRFWVALWWHLVGEGEGATYISLLRNDAGGRRF